MIGGSYPKCWNPTKPRRWTYEDIDLARSLKTFGATSIYKIPDHTYAFQCNDSCHCGILSSGSFKSLRSREEINIDNIIKESENEDWLDKYL